MGDGFHMSNYKEIIVFTGGSGRFGKILQKIKNKNNFFFPSSKDLDITNINKIEKYLEKTKPNILVHMAALSRPMELHDTDITKSIKLNIIGTANLVCACEKKNIKFVYFSTQYVYPGTKGNYKETDALLPSTNYAWSKLGGEASVQMYKNSLILRIAMTEKPFVHKKAFADVKTNFIYHDELVPIFLKILDNKGIINLGGAIQTVYRFAIKSNNKIKKIYARRIFGKKFPLNPSMNISKLNKIIKK